MKMKQKKIKKNQAHTRHENKRKTTTTTTNYRINEEKKKLWERHELWITL